MLPAAYRLRRHTDFASTVRHGRRVGRARIVVHLDCSPGASGGVDAAGAAATSAVAPARVGFVVGRAVGGAVVRNRVRRQLRHLVADRLGSLPPGSCLVVRALPNAAGASSAVLASELDGAMARALRSRAEHAASGTPR